ncbi:MAG: septal ring lytic transglycosylase RlpA family protein [Burkholderiaceae bacterium]
MRGPVPTEKGGRMIGGDGDVVVPALPPARSGRGGYYQDDGPGDAPPADLLAIPDAEPKIEPYLSRANRPYVVFGKSYSPITDNLPLKQRGIGSWYGRKFHGQKTSSGELYDMYKMTAAHPTLPIPSYARVTNLNNGKHVIVRINDRGPFHSSRIIDVSYTAAFKLGYLGYGSSELEVERLLPEDIVQMHSGGYARAAAISALSIASPVPRERAAPSMATPAPALSPVTAVIDITAVPLGAARAPVAGQSLEDFLKDREPPSASSHSVQARRPELLESMQSMQESQDFGQPTMANTASAVTASGFYLQFGAFSQSTYAQAARGRLMQHWPQSLPPLEIRQNGDFYRIYSGPFETRAAAAEAATHSESLFVRPMIIQP